MSLSGIQETGSLIKNKDSLFTVLKPGKFNVKLICHMSLSSFAWWGDSHDNVASSMSAFVSASCEPGRPHGVLSCSHQRTMVISPRAQLQMLLTGIPGLNFSHKHLGKTCLNHSKSILVFYKNLHRKR